MRRAPERRSEDAREAFEAGRQVFIAGLTTQRKMQLSTDATKNSGWAEQVEAIEAEGWRLDQWSVADPGSSTMDFITAYCVFRRA